MRNPWVILETMTGQDLIALRLANQQLIEPSFTDTAGLVAYLGAVQAQDYNGAKWSLGVRLPGSTDRSIEQRLVKKEIVRTWIFRGTLFFVSPADVRWMVALVGQRVIDSIQGRYRQLELDEGTLNRCSDLIVKALRDKEELTRKDLLAMLEKNGISTKGLRAPHILQKVSLEGLVCQAAAIKNNPTYFLMDRLPPQPNVLSHDEAIIELAKRYFASHGPATLKDFAWWLGLPVAETKIGLEAIQSQLTQNEVDGQIYWQSASKLLVNGYAQSIFLLPAADEYLLGYQDRSPILDARHVKMLSQVNGLNPFILKNGKVAGTWRRTIGKKEVVLKINATSEIDQPDLEALYRAAIRYGEFLDLAVNLKILI